MNWIEYKYSICWALWHRTSDFPNPRICTHGCRQGGGGAFVQKSAILLKYINVSIGRDSKCQKMWQRSIFSQRFFEKLSALPHLESQKWNPAYAHVCTTNIHDHRSNPHSVLSALHIDSSALQSNDDGAFSKFHNIAMSKTNQRTWTISIHIKWTVPSVCVCDFGIVQGPFTHHLSFTFSFCARIFRVSQ